MEYATVVILLQLLTFAFIAKLRASQYGPETDPGRCCKRIGNTTLLARSCKTTRLTANEFQQSISTPAYPNPFEPDIFCKWEIFARPGRRILLDIRNLKLAAKTQDDCKTQQLVVTSPMTGLSTGAFCGHRGLPNIVTTGNYIVVELRSPKPVGSKDYKGFQIFYMETVQATSMDLRPSDWSDGMYLEYDGPRSPLQPRIHYNPIQYSVTGQNTASTRKTKQKSTGKDHPNRKPPKEKNRVMSNPNKLRDIPRAYYIPNFRAPVRHDTAKNDEEMGAASIVGIVCGGVFVIVIIGVVIAKIRKSHKQDRKPHGGNERSLAATNEAFHAVEMGGILPCRPYHKVSNASRSKISNDIRTEHHSYSSKNRTSGMHYATTPRDITDHGRSNGSSKPSHRHVKKRHSSKVTSYANNQHQDHRPARSTKYDGGERRQKRSNSSKLRDTRRAAGSGKSRRTKRKRRKDNDIP